MLDSALKYVKNELIKYNGLLQSIENNIQSCEIEIKTIEKRQKALAKERDNTGDILHSVTASGRNNVAAKTLDSTKNEIDSKLAKLQQDKAECLERIKEISDVLQETDNELHGATSENVSCETSVPGDELLQGRHIIDFIETDRQRISRDIHDTVVQSLTALIHKQEFISRLIETDRNRCKLELSNSISIIKESINELRSIIFELRPMSYDDLGFKAAFINLTDKFDDDWYDGVSTSASTTGLDDKKAANADGEDKTRGSKNHKSSGKDEQSDSDDEKTTNVSRISKNRDIIYKRIVECDDDVNIDSATAISVLRIVNELNSNAVKHSGCKNIFIHLTVDDKKITLEFTDDGCGFDYDSCAYDKDMKTGYGMASIRERVSILRGTIRYENNHGSRFVIEMPRE